MDIIFIRDLRLETRIGAYEFERRKPQSLQFDIEIGRDRIGACDNDQLADTIDYAEVVKTVQAILAEHDFHLLEPLAERIAQMLLQRFGAKRVRLEVTKTGAVPSARYVGVRIERTVSP